MNYRRRLSAVLLAKGGWLYKEFSVRGSHLLFQKQIEISILQQCMAIIMLFS